MTAPMPACEALAADPDRYMLPTYLRCLVEAPSYELKKVWADRIGGYLCALLEAEVIDLDQHHQMNDEIHAFVWGTQG